MEKEEENDNQNIQTEKQTKEQEAGDGNWEQRNRREWMENVIIRIWERVIEANDTPIKHVRKES